MGNGSSPNEKKIIQNPWAKNAQRVLIIFSSLGNDQLLGDAYEATRYHRSSLLHQIRNTYTQIHSGLTTKKWGQNVFVRSILFIESDGD